MKEPLVSIKLHNRSRVVPSGSTLAGEFQIDAVSPEDIRAVEVSVLWRTEGKGDEDMAVHYFQRYAAETSGPTLHELRQFSMQLPYSPLSYDGHLLKIRWCVRVRVFLTGGKQSVGELPFQLGNLPSRRSVTGRSKTPAPSEVVKEKW